MITYQIPTVTDPRGKLSFIEGDSLPFEIKRIYYMYNTTQGMDRGFHAHRDLQQIMIAVAGSLTVTLDDGKTREAVTLCSPSFGVFLPPMVWREMSHFTPDAVCLVLASKPYDESDYIRSYDDFLKMVRK